MREALSQVRRDLGGAAVILGTREVRRRRFLGLAGLQAPHSPAPPFPPMRGTPPDVPHPRMVTRM